MSVNTELGRLRADVGELVAEHKRGRSLETFQPYRDDPVGFVTEVLGADPWRVQREVAELVRDHRRVVVRSGHAVGKDWVAGRLALWWALARRGLVIITSATERQAIGQTFGEFRSAWEAVPDLPGEMFTAGFRIGGRDRVRAFTSTNVENLTGWHDPNGVLVVISEGQGERVEDVGYDAAFSNATDPESRILALGNPTKPVGRFFEINRANNWRSVAVSVFQHPNVVEGRMVIPGGPSPEWPQEVADEYGADSAFYRSRVLGEFPTAAVEQLVKPQWIEAAVGRWRERERAGGWDGPVLLSLDVARFGADQSALAVIQNRGVRGVEVWRSTDTMETAGRVAERAAALPCRADVIVDEVGLGAGVLDRLVEDGWRARGFNGSRSAKRDSRYSNARAEAAWLLRQALERGGAPLPDDAALAEELLALEWALDGQGRVQLVSKDDVRKRIKRSPDRGDACMMGLWALPRRQRVQGVRVASIEQPGVARDPRDGWVPNDDRSVRVGMFDFDT